jgi:hypothetical protein
VSVGAKDSAWVRLQLIKLAQPRLEVVVGAVISY